MNTVPVTLDEMLLSREERAFRQASLLERFRLPLCTVTLNIAGEYKDGFAMRLLAYEAAERLAKLLGTPKYRALSFSHTGPVGYLVFDASGERIKAAALEIEDAAPWARLLDLDVTEPNGIKLERSVERRCLLCGRPAKECARSRNHGLAAIQAATRSLLRSFSAEALSALAVQALYDEVHVTPKAGLVDERNTGAHRDMDLRLFEASAEALRPFFREFVWAGADREKLQKIGLRAERAMLDATGGVNTHRGAVYAFGLMLGAMGETLFSGELASVLLRLTEREEAYRTVSHGTEMLRRYGVGGARTEAQSGFPHAFLAADLLKTESGSDVLLHLMSRVSDTNVLYRGGAEGLEFLQTEARRILAAPQQERDRLHRELDDACIGRNLSAGGTADLLALGLFLHACRRRTECF